jgi:hypothetical protein
MASGFFPFENCFDYFRRYWLNIGPISEFGIGHDRSRIGIHQYDLVPLLAQRLTGLHAGIIELAALSDYNRTGPYQEDLTEVIIPRHAGCGE